MFCACASFQPSYRVKAMKPVPYSGEDQGEVWGTKVQYLTPDQAAAFVVHAKDGLLVWGDESPVRMYEKPVMFSMAGDGTIYATNMHEPGVFHHSSFVAGGPLAAAGELYVEQGRLKAVTDKSGHYVPGRCLTWQFLTELQRIGIELKEVELRLEVFPETSAMEFLKIDWCEKSPEGDPPP